MVREWQGVRKAQEEDRFAIVVSRYNETVTRRLLEGALSGLREGGVSEEGIDVVWVPGAWEIPLLVDRLARRKPRYAAILALGCVIRGETTHDQHINRCVSMELGRLAVHYQVPVPFGLLTCQTLDQALERAGGRVGNKGTECAEAALELADLMRRLLPDDG